MENTKGSVSLKNITVSFGGEQVLKGINLDIAGGEFVTFLGSSGCGKTTTLRVIGGFLNPDAGDIFFDGKKMNGVPANKRPVNTVFQRYALFPNMDVYNNIAFGLKVRKKSKQEIKEKVGEMLKLVSLTGFEKRSVDSLSGGQQQRVAIARALAVDPKILLLDEPLGALDLKLRKDMQRELKSIQKRLGITFIYVTHDQEEALSMSDTIVVMDSGKIQQTGSPTDIYNEPENAFVADFIGDSNILDGIMIKDRLCRFQGVNCSCVDTGFAPNEPVDIVVRPEDISVVPEAEGILSGVISGVTFKGDYYEVIVDIKGFKWMIETTRSHVVGERIGIKVAPEEIQVMKKSEYSGMYGDYSSFSEEFEEMSDPEVILTDEEEISEDEI